MESIKFNTELLKKGLIAIELVADTTPLVFIIDTGSNLSIIDKAQVNKLIKVKQQTIENNTVIGLNGNTLIKEKLTALLKYKNRKFNIDFIITDLDKLLLNIGVKNIVGILGNNFLIDYKCSLNFKTKILQI